MIRQLTGLGLEAGGGLEEPQLTLVSPPGGRPDPLWSSWCASSLGGPRGDGMPSKQRHSGGGPKVPHPRPENAGDGAMRVAIYARYSTDHQRVASIADQFRVCRLHAEKQGCELAPF
jgi:hypothetical protein